MRSGRVPVAAVSSPDDAQFWIRDTWGTAYDRGVATWGRLAQGAGGRPGPAAVGQATRLAIQVSDRLAPYRKDEEKGVDPLAPPVPYPADNELGERLSRLAGLLSPSLIEQWLGSDAGEVIPNAGAFGRLALVR